MEDERAAKLTEGQKQCLRLVLRHMSSKDIARELDISPHTVDQRIRTAMKTLGAGSRVQAAFILARHEGLPGYQSPAYQSPYVAPDEPPVTLDPLLHGWRQGGEKLYEAVREDQAGFQAALLQSPRGLRWPLPGGGVRPHDISPLQRLGWIAAIAISTALAFGALLAGLEALAQLGRAFR
jgi:DNA-binding CsgD family transcriptional regulator